MADRPENVPEQFWNAEEGAINTEALLTAYGEATKPPEPGTKPEDLDEKFWDAEKGVVKTDDVLAAFKEATKPPTEPTDEEKTAAQAALVESYSDFNVPEGFEIDADGMKAAKELFAGMGLNKDQAQSLISLYAENAKGLSAQLEADGKKAWDDLHKEWNTAIEKDPDYGGAKLPETRAQIAKVIDKFGETDEQLKGGKLTEAFKLTGADSNPLVFRFLAKVAGVLSEGKFLQGETTTGGAPKSIADRMYPNGGNQNIGGQPPTTTEN